MPKICNTSTFSIISESNLQHQHTDAAFNPSQLQTVTVTQPEQWKEVGMSLCGPRNFEIGNGRTVTVDYVNNKVAVSTPDTESAAGASANVEQPEIYTRIKDVKIEKNENPNHGVANDDRISITFRDGIGLRLRYIDGEVSRTLLHPAVKDSRLAITSGELKVHAYDPAKHLIKEDANSDWEPLAPHLLSINDWRTNQKQAQRIASEVLQTLAGAGMSKDSNTKSAIALVAAGVAAYSGTYLTSLMIREGLGAALGDKARTSALGTGENPERDAALLFLYDFFHSVAAVAKDGAINAKKFNAAQGIDIGVKQIALPTLIGVIGKPFGVLKSWEQVIALVAPRPFTIAASIAQNKLLTAGVSKQKACAAYEGMRLASITPAVAALQLATDGPGFDFSRIGASAARTGAQFAQIYGAELNQWAQSATTFWQGDKAQENWIHEQLAGLVRERGEEVPILYKSREKYDAACKAVDNGIASCWNKFLGKTGSYDAADLLEVTVDPQVEMKNYRGTGESGAASSLALGATNEGFVSDDPADVPEIVIHQPGSTSQSPASERESKVAREH